MSRDLPGLLVGIGHWHDDWCDYMEPIETTEPTAGADAKQWAAMGLCDERVRLGRWKAQARRQQRPIQVVA